jgi:aryl-alcohol dehydrogenase-like predicted oxidoreductase
VWPPRSRLGLGLAALGRPGYINLGHAEALGHDLDPASMERRCHAVMDEAYALGVRHFDAARSYGRAEEWLASWPPRQDVTVSSKWGYTYTAGWRVDAEKHEVKDHSAANFDKQLAESRALFGDRLDLYQIHSATLESGVLDDRAVLARLQRLREAGVRVGLSLTGPRQAATLEKALALDLFDAVQATFNVLETSVGTQLARAHDAGLLVIVKECMANGRALEVPEVRAEAQRLGVGADAAALSFVLGQRFAEVVLSGAATVEQVRQNAAALSVTASLPDLAEPPDVYWNKRSRLPWN